MLQNSNTIVYKTVKHSRESDLVFMYVVKTEEQVPDTDSGVVCSVTLESSSGSFDNTLVCWRHRNDCAIWKEQRGVIHSEA